ncbi:MAG: hypothetical protein U9R25_08385 [Chloroflexota bacterium]|nr:hypothetical protein [Chloroflexota bacterium]
MIQLTAAGHAVATTHMADHAINAAAYALKTVTSASGENDVDAVAKEHDWQRQRVPDDIRELVLSAFNQQYSDLVPQTDACCDEKAG